MTSKRPSNISDSLVLFSSDDEESDSHHELKQYENLTAMLKGVPPPSSITISKFTVEEMLEKYHKNKELFGFGLESCRTSKSSSKNPVPFLKYSNSSPISEVIASLAQKVQERYIQMETMSSCNTWLKATLEACDSAKKRLRMRQSIGLSPSRRLSHLARRRQFFSSANLQRLANAENVRQIKIKKNINREDERKKTVRTVETEKLRSSKRALFLSPETGTPTKYGNTAPVNRRIYSSGSEERKLPLQERSKKVEVLKWLSQQNFEVDFPRKRLREECANHSLERKRKCPRRSLNFADDDVCSNVATSESNNSGDRRTAGSGKLSEIHKNKLLWAISVVLRESNITRKDEHFKTVAAKLFFICRKNLDEILNSNTAEGTSDKILHYARKIIPSVFKELGIKSSISSEINCVKEKESVNVESKNTDELKENINGNKLDNRDRGSSCPDSEVQFVFKTPRKIRQKRVVKSCQKVPNSGSKRKKNMLRRWRSLELLIEDAVQSSMMNVNTNLDKNYVSLNDGNNFNADETINCSDANNKIMQDKPVMASASHPPSRNSDPIESGNGFNLPESVIPLLPPVDTSVMFSPIPSSVKEESENTLYPVLRVCQTKLEEVEVYSDENDSMEILNQDDELKKGIDSLGNEGIFSGECPKSSDDLQKETIPDVQDNTRIDQTLVPPSLAENIQNVNEIAESSFSSDVNTSGKSFSVRSETYIDDIKTKESSNKAEFSLENSSEARESGDEKGLNSFNHDLNEGNEVWEPLTPECLSKVEKGTYKPRKLVVKKSKPNWKVVRKNSDETGNETELRLKMRLSHEWEIVCRNSSCSDVGNNSEYDATSMNCSQTSSATDKEISSENEAENSSRRSSAQSKFDDSIDEEITKSKVLVNNNFIPQIGESNSSHSFKLSRIGDEDFTDNLAAQAALIPAVPYESSENYNGLQLDHSLYQEESNDESAVDDNVRDALKIGAYNVNVDKVTQLREGCVAEEETENSENEDKELTSEVKSTSFGRSTMQCQKISSEENCEEEKRKCSDEEVAYDSSQISFTKKRWGEKSKKGKREKSHNISPETGVKEEDYFPSKRNRELDSGQCDSESGNSSSSNGPERKKRLLSFENYKARKLEEASNGTKSNVSNEESESKDVSDVSSDEKVSEGDVKKKIYNIRLKHPIGHHRKHKRKLKYKEHCNERKTKHKTRERNRERSESVEGRESEADGSSCSSSNLHSLRQFLNSFSENGPATSAELNDGVKRNLQNLDEVGISNTNSKDVHIQTIVDALSVLSSLVRKQIELENDKMMTQKESGENVSKKSKWLDVVSSWCGKNLNNLNISPNASSLSIHRLDNKSVADMKKVFNLNLSPSSESISNNGNSISTEKEIVNGIDPLINTLKTEPNIVQDCVIPSSSAEMNLVLNAGSNIATSADTGMDLSKDNVISHGIRLSGKNSQAVNVHDYSMYSGIESQSKETSLNTSESFSAFSEVRGVSTVKDYKLSGGSIGFFNSEPKVNFKHVNTQENYPRQRVKDPRCSLNYGTTSERFRGDNPDVGSSECSGYGKLNSSYPSNCVEYSPAVQTPYQFPDNYLNTPKPSFFQPNLYGQCPNWQIPSHVESLNYHQNTMSDGYQNSPFYPFQMSNVPYYLNKY